MNFRATATVTSVITLLLGAAYALAGPLVLSRWQLLPDASALLLARRVGALYLGLSVIFFLARSAPSSPARKALSAGTAVACFLLATTGLHAIFTGLVGPGMLVSVALELLLSLAFLRLFVLEHRATTAA